MRVDVFHDLVCPWCYLGKGRLQRALAARSGLEIQVVWRPFLLNPGIPADGLDRTTYLDLKYGSRERARQAQDMITQTARKDGVDLDFSRVTVVPSTLTAHRLVTVAARMGFSQSDLIDRMFQAYLIEGRDIGDRNTLCAILSGAGMPRWRAEAIIDGEDGMGQVRAADAAARKMGIQAVPCTVFDGHYAISGAQEPAAFDPLIDLAFVTGAA